MLAVLGGIYAVSAVVVLAYFVLDAWSALNTTDLVLQMALLIVAASGLWFLVNALTNLGWRHQPQRSAHR
ncbi:MAG TPA: hypothetical protein VEK79_24720 [Thermoanaerobaculia bacterium]|nr:hypothetical protein [Thermoanaerobaculia bacterium]